MLYLLLSACHIDLGINCCTKFHYAGDLVSYIVIVFLKMHFSALEKVRLCVRVQGSKCTVGKARQFVR